MTTMQSKKRKQGRRSGAKKSPSAKPTLDPFRTGMPALDSITGVEEFKKGKQVYRIIHTNERDEYEPQPQAAKHKKPRSTGEDK